MESKNTGIELSTTGPADLGEVVPIVIVDTDTDTDTDTDDDGQGSPSPSSPSPSSSSPSPSSSSPSERSDGCRNHHCHLFLVAAGLLASVAGTLLASYLLSRAGNTAITSKIKSTLELAGQAAGFRISTAIDNEAYRVSLLSDALARGMPLVTNLSSPGSVLVLPEREARIRKSDFFWITAMKELLAQSVSVYYAAEHTGDFQGAYTDYDSGHMFVVAQDAQDGGVGTPLVKFKFPVLTPASPAFTLDHEMRRNASAGAQSPGLDFTQRPWYVAAKAAGDAALASNRSDGHDGKDTLPAVWALYKDLDEFTGTWTLTHAQAYTDRSGAAAATAASGETASISGAVGADFGVQVIHDIITNVKSEVFRSQPGEMATITIFLKPEGNESNLLILASSDAAVQAKINGAKDVAGLSMPLFATTELATLVSDSLVLDVARISAEQATLFRSERRSNTNASGHTNANMNASAVAANTTVSFRGEIDGTMLVTVVALDHIFGGAYATVAIRSTYVYEAEQKAWIVTVVSVLLMLPFVANALLQIRIESGGKSSTNTKPATSRTAVSEAAAAGIRAGKTAIKFNSAASRAVASVFATFIVIFFAWFTLQNAAMTMAARRLTEQLNAEITQSLSRFVALPPAINRFNYVLHSLGALPLGYFPDEVAALNSIVQETSSPRSSEDLQGLGITRKQLQIHADAAFSDEMRRAKLNTRPYFVYMGAGTAFSGVLKKPESRNMSTGHNLGFHTQIIDSSTGSKPGTGELGLEARKVHGVQYSVGERDSALYTRDASPAGFVGVSYGYNPSKRPWYISQRNKPNSAVWSEPYLFSSGFEKTIGISATECYMCPGSRNLAALTTNFNDRSSGGSSSSSSNSSNVVQEIVLSVDYTLGGISERLNSTMEYIRKKFPQSKPWNI